MRKNRIQAMRIKKHIVSLCLLFLFGVFFAANCFAAENGPSRVINVVYDDSGSMYENNDDVVVDTWCQAKYSMEVFAAMLGPNDTMHVYYMSDYQGGGNKGPRLTLNGGDGATANVNKIHAETTRAGATPFHSVRKAYSDLAAETADERWLVILTDGAFEDGRTSREEVDAYLAQKDPDISVMFLAMGPDAAGITQKQEDNIFYVEARTNSQILGQITGICTRVFNSNRLEVNPSTKTISFDVPMGELTVFAQGANVKINGVKTEDGRLIKSAKAPVKVSYSDCDAVNYSNEPTTDLLGSVVTFVDDFESGTYTLDVTGAESIEVYYKPNVEVAMYLSDSEGKEVTDIENLEVGDYTISFGFVKAGTDQPVNQSSLLGNITYEANVTNNGVLHEQTYASGDTIHLEEGPLTVEIIARYLDYNSVSTTRSYDIFRNKNVTFRLRKDPLFDLKSGGRLDENQYLELELQADDHIITEEEWKAMSLPDVTLTDKKSSSRIQGFRCEKTDEIGIYRIYPVLPEDGARSVEYGDFSYEIEFRQQFGEESWYGKEEKTMRFRDSRSWFEKNKEFLIRMIKIGILVLFLAGYLPFIKNYLPKTLKRRPNIRCTPQALGQRRRNEEGLFRIDFISTVLPYVSQKGSLQFVPDGVYDVTPLSLKAMRSHRMKVLNYTDYADEKNIRFNGQQVKADDKNLIITAGGSIEVKRNGWKYYCLPTEAAH